MDILIVDDDMVDREHIKRILKRGDRNCAILEAESVDEGLALLTKHVYDVILLDCNLPQRDGIELLKELKQNTSYSSTAVIMMSTSEDEKLALDCLNAGAQDFITKQEISTFRLRRAILNAQTRFNLEQALVKSYQKVKLLAEHDSLTGLANRHLFDESLKLSVTKNERESSNIALILIDLDHFKYVNDNHGHDVGDQLLIKVVNRIRSCLRGTELFARLGGDEFAITINQLGNPEDANLVAMRIINVLHKPFIIGEATVKSGASIGISLHPNDGKTSEELFKHADIAMYRAKKNGRNQYSFFESKMKEQFLARYIIENKLHKALANKEFILYYQPIFEPGTAKLLGFETLIRWQRNNKFLSPDEFIPIAESSGLIVEIGGWIITEAIQQISLWNIGRLKPLTLAINLSPVQLGAPNLVKLIDSCLLENNLKPELIEFELTETALLIDSETTRRVIESISNLGCRLALDDFGTGFSSLSHLSQFPIDSVKIDKSITMGVSSQGQTERIAAGLVAMIQSLGMESIAEGVESAQHLTWCKENGVNKVQGYFFERPLPIEQVETNYLSAKITRINSELPENDDSQLSDSVESSPK